MDFDRILAYYAADDRHGRLGFTTMTLTVKAHPPTGGDPEQPVEKPLGTTVGYNPFVLDVGTNDDGSDTVTFTYGTGTTTFTDDELATYFTGAPTSCVVSEASPDASPSFDVLAAGTVYWVTASGCGITTAEQSFELSS